MAKNSNNANPNIVQVECAENVTNQLLGHLQAIAPQTAEENIHKNDAIEAVAEFQKEELFKLRGAFE